MSSSKKINTFAQDPETPPSSQPKLAANYSKSIEEILKNFKVNHKYEHLTEVGKGGMGSVTLSRDSHTLRKVAIKTLNEELLDNSEAVIRFSEEAQITAQLEHPNIIPVYELGINERRAPFYTMKYVNGTNLKEILKLIREENQIIINKFHVIELLSVFVKVCDAMSFACSKGVLHRDLKPENIMIGEFGEVLVVDWGLAKTFTPGVSPQIESSGNLTENINKFIEDNISTIRSMKNISLSIDDCLMGTPQYMAPERIVGPGDERSEIFALGTILYDILALTNMFNANEVKEVLKKIATGEHEPLTTFKNLPHIPGGKVPQALSAVVEKATAQIPDNRYQSINELKSDIESYILGFATKAESAGFFRILKLAIVRHKKVSAIIILLFTALLFISGVFIYELVHSRQNALNKSNYAKFLKESANRKTKLVEMKSIELEQKVSELKQHSTILYENAVHEAENLNFEEALRNIQYAIDLDPEKNEYHFFIGKLQLALMEFDLAIASFKKIPRDTKIDFNVRRYRDMAELMSTKIKQGKFSSEDSFALHQFFKNRNDFSQGIAVLNELREDSRYDQLLSEIWQLRLKELNFIDFELETKSYIEAFNGEFNISIRKQDIYDLSPLASMPIKRLAINGCRISTLKPLKNLNIEELSLYNLNISDLTPIKNMPLQILRLRNCKVSSLAPLEGMKLKTLSIENCPVVRLDPLRGMELIRVELDNTLITVLGPLKNMPIRHLSANNTRIKNLIPLRGMPLRYLYLNSTSVQKLNGIENTALTALHLDQTYVTEVEKLNTKNLEEFYMSGTPLKDISFLKDAEKLKVVGLSDTQITSLEPLRGIKVSKVYIDNVAIKDITPVTNSELNEIQISNSFASDISSLKNCRKLESLSAQNCGISDISSLNGLPLKRVNLSGNINLKDLSFIDIRSLERLDLRSTGVKDISFLKGAKINYLNLTHTSIKDISAVSTLENLTELHIKGCDHIQSVKPLMAVKSLRILIINPFLPDVYILEKHPGIEKLDMGIQRNSLEAIWNVYKDRFFHRRIIPQSTDQ